MPCRMSLPTGLPMISLVADDVEYVVHDLEGQPEVIAVPRRDRSKPASNAPLSIAPPSAARAKSAAVLLPMRRRYWSLVRFMPPSAHASSIWPPMTAIEAWAKL